MVSFIFIHRKWSKMRHHGQIQLDRNKNNNEKAYDWKRKKESKSSVEKFGLTVERVNNAS